MPTSRCSTDLSIVIVNWNTRDLLRACLESLQVGSDSLSTEVWVVDNASSDGSAEMVRHHFPWVHLVANESNLGFAAANNQALLVASGKHVLLLNSDTVVLGNALDEMVAYLEAHPEVGAVGCRLLKTDGTVQRSCWRGFPSLTFALVDALYLWKLAPRWRLVQSSEIRVEDLQEPIKVDHLLGACMMVRQEVIKQVGKLDPGYFLFLEETDWCYRIQEAGCQIHYLPTVQIIHYGEQSTRKNPERSLPELYRSYCRFCRKMHHFGWGKMQLLKAIIVIAASLRVGLWLWRLFWSDRALARRMICGYVRVLAELPSF